MASSSCEIDSLSQWCVKDDLANSFWLKNNDAYNLLIQDIPPLPSVTFDEILERSAAFPVKFPIDTVKCQQLQQHVSKDILEVYINSVYPVIHEKVLQLCAKFLLQKRASGSAVEKELYKDMTIPDFIDRLLKKRAVTFVGAFDRYRLLDGTTGTSNWESIGTDKERPPLILEKCLSYDEIKISAFLSVSSFTHFLNVGDRFNKGVYFENRKDIQDEGIIIGLIGPRFRRNNAMDHEDIDKKPQRVKSLFTDIYKEKFFNYNDIVKKKPSTSERFTEYFEGMFFDNAMYAKRLALSFDTLLFEANTRARQKSTFAYVHVVGIGLGVWRISSHQNQLFMKTFSHRIEQLGKYFHNVSDVCLAYMGVENCGKYKNGDVIPIEGHPNGGIKIHIYNRQPHQKLEGNDAGKLLVASYAWDANSLPGNEFWDGSLWTSSDPAAACSTQVAEFHNAHINPRLCGNNLHVVTYDGVISLKEYQDRVKIAQRNKKQDTCYSDVSLEEYQHEDEIDQINKKHWSECVVS